MRLHKTIIFVTTVALLSGGVFPAAAKLQVLSDECTTLGIKCGDGSATQVSDILVSVVNMFLALVGIIAAAVLVYAGFKYITSAGDDKKAEEAKRIILYAVIGLIVIGLSAVLVNFVLKAIGVG